MSTYTDKRSDLSSICTPYVFTFRDSIVTAVYACYQTRVWKFPKSSSVFVHQMSRHEPRSEWPGCVDIF